MVNWSDPAEIARDAGPCCALRRRELTLHVDAFNKLLFALFGLYFWELCTTFRFDWEIITKKRAFKWPLSKSGPTRVSFSCSRRSAVFYLLTRYSLFFALLGLMITITVTTEVRTRLATVPRSF